MKLFSSYYSKKISCLLGLHSWIYQVENVEVRSKHTDIPWSADVSTRFCTSCYKKQIRNRRDMNIVYVDFKSPLTKDQTRVKNLNTILHGKD